MTRRVKMLDRAACRSGAGAGVETMQTSFTSPSFADPEGAESEKTSGDVCIAASATRPAQPYVLRGEELDLRAALYLIKDSAENERPATAEVVPISTAGTV